MAGRGRGTPGPGGRELTKRGSGSDLGARRGDRRDTKSNNTADKNTAAPAEKPQPKQVKEAVQESKSEQTAASVQVRGMMLQCAAERIRRREKPCLALKNSRANTAINWIHHFIHLMLLIKLSLINFSLKLQSYAKAFFSLLLILLGEDDAAVLDSLQNAACSDICLVTS